MNLYILGAGGMMGSMFLTYILKMNRTEGFNVIPIYKEQFNVLIDDISDIIPTLACAPPEVALSQGTVNKGIVFNFIGCIPQKTYTNDEYVKINQEFPHVLAKFCKEHQYGMVHLSTNCVFDGKLDGYTEDNIPSVSLVGDIYSETKYKGEPSYGLVIRSSIIGFGSGGLLSWFMSSSDVVNGYTNHIWNGLTTLELSKVIMDIINKDITLLYTRSLRHIFSRDTQSKYDLLVNIGKVFEKNIQIIPYKTTDKFYTLQSIHDPIYIPTTSIYEQLVELKMNKPRSSEYN